MQLIRPIEDQVSGYDRHRRMERFLCDFDRMIFAVNPGNSRFGAFNSRLGRREFPFRAATGISSQRADLANLFWGKTTGEREKWMKFPVSTGKTGNLVYGRETGRRSRIASTFGRGRPDTGIREREDGFWRIDVFHRLLDDPGGAGPGAGGARLRVGLAPEHSHIPSSRLTPPAGGGELGKQYYDVMDPFVTLTAAAMATKTLKLATGVCLVIQRDTVQTAKLVASIDQVSGGR